MFRTFKINKNKEGVMNEVETEELNPVQYFLAKSNIQLTILQNKTRGIPITLLLLAVYFLGKLIGLIPTISFEHTPFTGAVVTLLFGVLLVTEIIISDVGGKYKRALPEYQIKTEKEKLENLIKQAEYLKTKDSRANKPIIENLIGKARKELETTKGNVHQRLGSIRKITKDLEEFVNTIQAIKDKQDERNTLKQEWERKGQEITELDQKLSKLLVIKFRC